MAILEPKIVRFSAPYLDSRACQWESQGVCAKAAEARSLAVSGAVQEEVPLPPERGKRSVGQSSKPIALSKAADAELDAS